MVDENVVAPTSNLQEKCTLMTQVLCQTVPVFHPPYCKKLCSFIQTKSQRAGLHFILYGKRTKEICGDAQLVVSWLDAVRRTVSSQDRF